jgi:quinoprotein glucose dehydrogenase
VQYSINGQYGVIGTMMKPPYTTITSYDLNKGTIRWQTGFGDDPTLAALGIRGTGMSQMRNSVIVTASGLLFGFGGDSTIYAYDTDTGKVSGQRPLWRIRRTRFSGDVRNSTVALICSFPSAPRPECRLHFIRARRPAM